MSGNISININFNMMILQIFLAIFTSAFTNVNAQCQHEDSTSVVCVAQEFQLVPSCFDKDIQNLVLSKNNISALNKDALRLYSLVKDLNLDDNAIRSTNNIKAISEMRKLRKISLSGNGLINLEFGVFSMNIYLEEVVIDNNPNVYVKEKPVHLRRLRRLSLKHNKHNRFPIEAFKDFSKLEFLDFRNNELAYLPEDLHIILPNLKQLLMYGNPIINLNHDLHLKRYLNMESNMEIPTASHIFTNNSPKVNEIRENNFRRSGCSVESCNIVVCAAQGYKTIPDSFSNSITRLNLSKNNISELDGDVLSLYPHIAELNLYYNMIRSSNNLKNISKLKELMILHVSSNGIIYFDFQVFSRNTRLEEIYIENNPQLHVKEKPTNLKSLKKVFLKGNELVSLPMDAFKKFSNLEFLDVSNNKLAVLPTAVMSVFPNLKQLLICDNPILNFDESFVLHNCNLLQTTKFSNILSNRSSEITEKVLIPISNHSSQKNNIQKNSDIANTKRNVSDNQAEILIEGDSKITVTNSNSSRTLESNSSVEIAVSKAFPPWFYNIIIGIVILVVFLTSLYKKVIRPNNGHICRGRMQLNNEYLKANEI